MSVTDKTLYDQKLLAWPRKLDTSYFQFREYVPCSQISIHLEYMYIDTVCRFPPVTCITKATTITKPCLYNFDPLKPHFYLVKLGITLVYIIFLISAQNIDCGYSLEAPRRGASNEYPQSMFRAEI